jgi:hypothetical protein
LNDALDRAQATTWDLDQMRVVLFSDLHRGYGDGADDFRKCAGNYHRALDFYLEDGYTLLILGDSEELWECKPGKVVATYGASLENEARFVRTDTLRYAKIWGNHDDLWKDSGAAARHLETFFGEVRFPECLDVKVTSKGEVLGRLFLVHGHQGTPGSDKWQKYSRPLVRWVWRPIQRLFKISVTTPATSFEARGKHDRAMYDWAAARNDLVLIAGHTHRPVFLSRPNVETIERIYSHLLGPAPEKIDRKSREERLLAAQELEWARAEAGSVRIEGVGELESSVGNRSRPCYFNTGCCSFKNGEITGIEIADGQIRLIRWAEDLVDPADRVIEHQSIQKVFAELNA